MRKRNTIFSLLIITMLLAGCGNSANTKEMGEDEKSKYVNGIQVVDLLDENTYQQNGSKMVKSVEKALNASPNDFSMLEQKAQVFSNVTSFEITFDNGDCDFYYIGEIKNNKPHGYGVITSWYEGENMGFYYIGEFKNGEVADCYGITLEGQGGFSSILYEGTLAYLTYEDLYPVPADGKQIKPHDFFSISNYYDKPYDNRGFSETKVAKCLPEYIGEMKDGEYSGKGTQYYPNGTVMYEGEFKAGQYHGKGKQYTSEGLILKEGTFKRGELKDGKYYRENE